jgi:hypothetical protein
MDRSRSWWFSRPRKCGAASDPAEGEELAVWKNGETIAAVARADGSIHVYEQGYADSAYPSASNGKRRRK